MKTIKQNLSDQYPPAKTHFEFYKDAFLWAVVLCALVLRLAVSWELSRINHGVNSVFVPAASTDLATYMHLAREVWQGTYHGVYYYQPFYYAVFLPFLYFLSGGSIWFVILVQALLGSITVFFCYDIAWRISGSRNGGRLAAFMTAVSTPLLLYTPFHQNETLQTFNLCFLFWCALRWSGHLTFLRTIALGSVASIAILTRGNIWFEIPLLAAWILIAELKKVKLRPGKNVGFGVGKIFVCVVVFTFFVLVWQLPFAIKNSIGTGKISGASTAGEVVLALGNTVEAPPGGRNPGLPAGPMEYPESFDAAMERSGCGISVKRQMLNWLMDNPLSFLELQLRKMLLFWTADEIPNNVSLYGEGCCSCILNYLLIGRSGVLLPVAVAGICLAFVFKLKKYCFGWFVGFIVIFWLSIALFYNLSRFRAPVLPLIFCGSAFFIKFFEDMLANRRQHRTKFLLAFLFLLAGVWFINNSYDFYRNHLEIAVMRLVRPNGTNFRMLNGENVFFDHGPFSFGDWQEVELKCGDKISKEFAVASLDGKVIVPVFASASGNAVFDVGGQCLIFSLKRGENRLPFKVNQKGNVFEFCLQDCEHKLFLVKDAQRDYDRSLVNNEKLNGELTFRYYATKPEQSVVKAGR